MKHRNSKTCKSSTLRYGNFSWSQDLEFYANRAQKYYIRVRVLRQNLEMEAGWLPCRLYKVLCSPS